MELIREIEFVKGSKSYLISSPFKFLWLQTPPRNSGYEIVKNVITYDLDSFFFVRLEKIENILEVISFFDKLNYDQLCQINYFSEYKAVVDILHISFESAVVLVFKDDYYPVKRPNRFKLLKNYRKECQDMKSEMEIEIEGYPSNILCYDIELMPEIFHTTDTIKAVWDFEQSEMINLLDFLDPYQVEKSDFLRVKNLLFEFFMVKPNTSLFLTNQNVEIFKRYDFKFYCDNYHIGLAEKNGISKNIKLYQTYARDTGHKGFKIVHKILADKTDTFLIENKITFLELERFYTMSENIVIQMTEESEIFVFKGCSNTNLVFCNYSGQIIKLSGTNYTTKYV